MTARYKFSVSKHHPRANKRGQVLTHILVAERALGKLLPRTAEVHHVNSNRFDNHNANLVICENHKYHSLLHARARVLRAGGNPNVHRICGRCKQLHDRAVLHGNNRNTFICRPCHAVRMRQYHANKRTALKEVA